MNVSGRTCRDYFCPFSNQDWIMHYLKGVFNFFSMTIITNRNSLYVLSILIFIWLSTLVSHAMEMSPLPANGCTRDSVLMVFEQGRVFIQPHLMWHKVFCWSHLNDSLHLITFYGKQGVLMINRYLLIFYLPDKSEDYDIGLSFYLFGHENWKYFYDQIINVNRLAVSLLLAKNVQRCAQIKYYPNWYLYSTFNFLGCVLMIHNVIVYQLTGWDQKKNPRPCVKMGVAR